MSRDERAVSLQELLETATAQHAAGNFLEAENAYRSLLSLHSSHSAALAGLGALAGQTGRAELAAEYLRLACAQEPANPLYLHNYGEALRQQGQLPEAEAKLRRVIEIDPHFLPAYTSLLNTLQTANDRALAVGNLQHAAVLATELAALTSNQGNALLDIGQAPQAIECYRRALLLQPDYVKAWSNLGNALRLVGQISEAETACRRAVELDPGFSAAWNNLGNALSEQGRYEEAPACYERALAHDADSPEAVHNRGSGSLFGLLFLPELDPTEIADRHRAWGAAFPAPKQRPVRHDPRPQPGRVLRVGYLSADFRKHAMLHFIEPVLAGHDAGRFEVVCYAQGPYADEHTRRLMQYGHRWTWVHELDDGALAARIERDSIDILVDCAGHTAGTRLTALAGKPAPVMMSWLGYLGTTGLPVMDYRLTDKWVDPPGLTQSQHTEALIRIPDGMMAYRPHAACPDPNPPPGVSNGYVTFGSLNNIQKINAVLVALWAKILRALPHSRLLLQTKHLVDAGMAGRVRGLFEAFGIRPGRLDLRPASGDFMRTYHEIDIALDTLPYGGGATTCDALWMGVPVITLSGERPAGRLSTSILHQIGRPEWTATSDDGYVGKAIELAQSLGALQRTRQELRGRMQASALCDEAGFVRRLEKVYRDVAGGGADTFDSKSSNL